MTYDFRALAAAAAGAPLTVLGLVIADCLAARLPAEGVDTPLRIAHFLAQASEETDHFRTLTEYGGPAYFAQYDGREDLGNVMPGDGARFRGRGIFDVTGRANYRRLGDELGLDAIARPELMADPNVAVRAALDYWRDHDLAELADADAVALVTKRVNGGFNGLPERKRALARVKAALEAAAEAAPAPPQPEPEASPIEDEPAPAPVTAEPDAPAPQAPEQDLDDLVDELAPWWKGASKHLTSAGLAIGAAFSFVGAFAQHHPIALLFLLASGVLLLSLLAFAIVEFTHQHRKSISIALATTPPASASPPASAPLPPSGGSGVKPPPATPALTPADVAAIVAALKAAGVVAA